VRAPESRIYSVAVPTRTWLFASVGVLVLTMAVAALGDPSVNSGSDAGGKLATVVEMSGSGLDGGSIGYWAESADPTGRFHPLVNTQRTDRGWIQATSSVMPLASSVGYRVAGSFGALWLSFLAVPLGALAAAALSRQMGAASGWLAFAVIGVASPLAFYGADQWEHGLAIAATLWALVLLRGAKSRPQVLALGVLVGLCVVLRREVVFVLLALGVVELLNPSRRQWWRGKWLSGAAALGLSTVLFGVVGQLDHRVLGQGLASRSASQISGAGTDLGQRATDTILTTVAQYPGRATSHMVLAAVTLLGVAVAAAAQRNRATRYVVLGLSMTAFGTAMRIFVGGLGFVPGAFAVLPLTAAAPMVVRRVNQPALWAVGVATALTVAFQWTGSLSSQWGGRYLLVPAAVIAIATVTEFERAGWRQPVAAVALAATVAIAGMGLVWHVQRTSSIGESRDEILALTSGEVVVSTHAHMPREIAVSLRSQRWLRADTLDDLADVMSVVALAAPGERVWLLHPGTCAQEPCGRTWAERGDGQLASGWHSGEVHEVSWLDGGTYVVEAFTPSH